MYYFEYTYDTADESGDIYADTYELYTNVWFSGYVLGLVLYIELFIYDFKTTRLMSERLYYYHWVMMTTFVPSSYFILKLELWLKEILSSQFS